jgi:general secretion pathway protein G
VPDARDPKKRLIRFLRRLPRDPMHPDREASPQETWGKRSYESERASPQAGNNVYDVYSLNRETGLNGIAYNEW